MSKEYTEEVGGGGATPSHATATPHHNGTLLHPASSTHARVLLYTQRPPTRLANPQAVHRPVNTPFTCSEHDSHADPTSPAQQ